MDVPAHFDAVQYHLHALTSGLRAHEEWLREQQLSVTCDFVMQQIEPIAELVYRQAELTDRVRDLLAAHYRPPVESADPRAMEEAARTLDELRYLSRQTLSAAAELRAGMAVRCGRA